LDVRPTTGPSASAAAAVTPNVVGKDVADAGRILCAAGFRCPIPWQVDPLARGQPCSVARQEPPAGAAVRPGATAQLFLVSGKDCGGKD
jgi:beta-lactam-binding protein with PASTA domain